MLSSNTLNWKEVISLAKNGNQTPPKRVEHSKEEWKKMMGQEQFTVTREHGTERPFSGEYCESFEDGKYACSCCGTLLFDSSTKFDSGTGWPSFTEPVSGDVVKYISDNAYGMQRIEVQCNICEAHLGHVFPDGPSATTGLRFCMNSVSLKKLG